MSKAGKSSRTEDATSAVRERIVDWPVLKPVLAAIEAAAEQHPGVYLVGGGVRDLLLGVTSADIDIAVEGDALGFARDLAGALGSAAREHEHFDTAVVHTNELEIDVAGTRHESYAHPGALPAIRAAGIDADLARRDFTINAMAASLKRHDLGAVCDPHGGYRDLRSGTIRVLHEGSFVDDPTRLLRMARYAARFGFLIDDSTRELARKAAADELVGEMASGRVRDELMDLLSERTVAAALELAHELAIDRALHPRLAADAQTRATVERLQRPLSRLAALCAGMSATEVGAWMDRLKFTGEQRDAVVQAAGEGPSVGERLASFGGSRSQLAELLRGKVPETLEIAALAGDSAGELIDTYLCELVPIKLEIGGEDLLAAGVPEGPAIGEALRCTLAMKLDGEVDGREPELRAALEIARGGA